MVKTQSKGGKCSICLKEYTGWGNNAEPINKGQCCDKCNSGVVIPMRLGQYLMRIFKHGNKTN